MRKLDIAIAQHRNSKKWKNRAVDWEYLIEMCSKTIRTPETLKEYISFDKDRQSEIKDVGGFVGGYVTGGRRKLSSVSLRSLLTLDADEALPNLFEKFQMLYGNTALMYTTHKHHPDKPRYRLVIPLDRDVTVAEHEPIARRVSSSLGIEQFDITTYQANRLMYWPSTSKGAEFVFKHDEGEWLCADEILATYRNWQDASEWPMGEKENREIRIGMKHQGDPTEKKGVVGAYCRTYSIEEVLESELSDIYEPTDVEDRYTYIEGSTAAGLVLYDSKFAYSHHGTDPISGKLCNAFDLVRIHKFGHLDGNMADNTPVNRYPSHLAMEEYVLEDPEVRKLISTEHFSKAGDYFKDLTESEEGADWLADLESDRKGNFLPTHQNMRLILENDPALKNGFGYNVFALRTEVLGKLPWSDPEIRPWADEDWSGLNVYLGSPPYNLSRSDKAKDVLSVVKMKRKFNPVKNYLEGLKWDGKPRLDSLLVDFFGAEDSEYVRAVTRKTLVAAVARIYRPGCKFEYVLSLISEEGSGKSEFISRLGGEWFTDTFSFSMLSQGMRAYEQLQNSWIVEVGELAGYRKAEKTAVKKFLDSREDKFRTAYGKELVYRKRMCIFIASTNEEDFLSASNGNRRFWPVLLDGQNAELNVYEDFDQEYRDQVFAEAKHYFEKGESLFLPKRLEKSARLIQKQHEEYDEWSPLIEEWLNTPIESAQTLFSDTPKLREKVCVAEIWVEVFGGNVRDINSGNTRRIHSIMRKLKDWEEPKLRERFKGFESKQKIYRRVGSGGSELGQNNKNHT